MRPGLARLDAINGCLAHAKLTPKCDAAPRVGPDREHLLARQLRFPVHLASSGIHQDRRERQMSPGSSPLDAADMGLRDSIVGANFGPMSRVGVNGNDLLVGKDRGAVSFANGMRVVTNSVSHVLGLSVPAKVAKFVVARVPVVVAAAHSIRSRAAKCEKHQCMHMPRVASAKLRVRVSKGIWRRLKDSPASHLQATVGARLAATPDKPIKRSNAAKVADFIRALKARDSTPSFSHSDSLIESGFYRVTE